MSTLHCKVNSLKLLLFFTNLDHYLLSVQFNTQLHDLSKLWYQFCVVLFNVTSADFVLMSADVVFKSKVEIFFKNRELYWSNFPQNSNSGRELVQKSGVQIPVEEGQIFCPVFFSISNSPWKTEYWHIEYSFFIFFYQLNINKKGVGQAANLAHWLLRKVAWS